MKRFLPILLLLCLTSVVVRAQGCTDTLSSRPKVGLVLSGGGARGAAHVGVIRLIEEMGIPIDYVAGTSMGAIIGALYSIGYTADEMDSLLMAQDWKQLLSNGVPRTMQPYAQRIAEQQYQINIPYIDNVRTENSARYRDAGIRVSKRGNGTFLKAMARPGLIDGQNLSDKFAELTFAYHDSISYDCLPRPFACVATDLVTSRPVVLERGFLSEAIRASMSIPGVFYPVYKDSMVLVDGGVMNNYPVDVVRHMGADVVIGVDLNTSRVEADELHSFASIFERLISTMGVELRERNMSDTDVLILPDVGDFPVMGFDTLSLGKLIEMGYATALQSRPQLDSIALLCHTDGSVGSVLYDHPESMDEVIVISDINIKGYTPTDLLPLLSQYGIEAGNAITKEILFDAVKRIYGLGTFSSVQYHLVGESPYTLELHVASNPSNQVELGLRLDSEDAAAALLSIGIDRLRLSGPKLDFTTRLSVNPWVMVRAAYAWPDVAQLNASVKYWFSDVNRFYDKNSHAFSYHYYGSDIYLSNLFSLNYDLRLGARYDHFLVRNLVRSELSAYSYTSARSRDSYTNFYLQFRGDLYDAAYFPTRGYAYGLEAAYHIKNRGRGASNFWSLQGDASAVVPLGSTTALLPAFCVRSLLGEDIPLAYANVMGGYLPGRYMRQQVPFVGIMGVEFMERHLALLRMELRQRLMSDTYLSAIANYAYSTDAFSPSAASQSAWGLGLALSYDTTVGPLSLCGHWSDLHHRFGAYFSFGFEF